MPTRIFTLSRINDGRPFFQKSKPVKDSKGYAKWNREHMYCMACGISQHRAPLLNAGIGLSTHHIIKAGRSDEPCNLLRLCQRCHDLAENRTIILKGERLPCLSLGACLTIKKFRDRNNFDLKRLEVLRYSGLPDMEPIPEFIESEFRFNRPHDRILFFEE